MGVAEKGSGVNGKSVLYDKPLEEKNWKKQNVEEEEEEEEEEEKEGKSSASAAAVAAAGFYWFSLSLFFHKAGH